MRPLKLLVLFGFPSEPNKPGVPRKWAHPGQLGPLLLGDRLLVQRGLGRLFLGATQESHGAHFADVLVTHRNGPEEKNKQTNKQASKQASEQASKQASKQTNKQTNNGLVQTGDAVIF